MTAADVVVARPITEVWLGLGGDTPSKHGRARAFYRDGDNHQAVSLNDSKCCWFDHRDGTGGGVLDLIQRVQGCNRADALHWLADCVGLTLDDRPMTMAVRRTFAEQRRAASTAADEIANWRKALIPELNARKIAAIDAGDDEALVRAASLCNVLENGSPPDVAREFIRYQASDPADVARLIMAARELDLDAERIATYIVLLLSRAEAEDSRNDA